MSSNDEPWGPWVAPMVKAEAVDPRTVGAGKVPRPSWNQLARKAGISTSAITDAVGHRKHPKPATVQAIAKALDVTPATVSEWIGLRAPVGGVWSPPQEAALLSHGERKALDEFIRAVTLGRREERDGDDRDAAPTRAAPASGPAEIIPGPDAATAAELRARQASTGQTGRQG